MDKPSGGADNARLGMKKARSRLPDARVKPDRHGAGTRILLISDGRPGHYRQSEGIIAALRRDGPVTVDRLALKTHRLLPKAFVPKLARRLSPRHLLRFLHGLDPDRLARPDVIVSSGGTTLGANVALARLWQVPNVFSGSTRGFPLDAFRLVLTPYRSQAVAPNVVAGAKPTPFDPDGVPPPRPIRIPGDVAHSRVSVLIGGPTPYADFSGRDWERLATLLRALATEWRAHVTIVTSPRTPQEAYTYLVPLAGSQGDGGDVSLIDFRSAGPGSINKAFDCDLLLITSDSMSMMTEAALSRRPAIAMAPERVKPSKDDEAVDDLVAQRWMAILPLAPADATRVAEIAAKLSPPQFNHLDRLADHLRIALS